MQNYYQKPDVHCNVITSTKVRVSRIASEKKNEKRAIIMGMVESEERLRGALVSHKRVQCKPVAKYQRAALGVYIYAAGTGIIV